MTPYTPPPMSAESRPTPAHDTSPPSAPPPGPPPAPHSTADTRGTTRATRPKVVSKLKRFEPGAILFDFDGVLVHSEPLHFQAMRDSLAAEGIPLTESMYYEQCIGRDDRGAFRALFERLGKPLSPRTLLRLLATKSRRMREVIHEGRYHALPGVSELVRALARHYPLAICSAGLRDEVEAMLEGIGLRDCFLVVTAAEDVEVGKPDPSGYLQTLRQLGDRTRRALTPRDALVVEDAPNVITHVKAAGFRTLGVAGSVALADLAHADARVRRLDIDSVRAVLPRLRTDV